MESGQRAFVNVANYSEDDVEKLLEAAPIPQAAPPVGRLTDTRRSVPECNAETQRRSGSEVVQNVVDDGTNRTSITSR